MGVMQLPVAIECYHSNAAMNEQGSETSFGRLGERNEVLLLAELVPAVHARHSRVLDIRVGKVDANGDFVVA